MIETGLMIEPSIIEFNKIGQEETGYISVAQCHENVPFEIKRVFWVYGTPTSMGRGNHAHRQLIEIVVAVSGRAEIVLEDQWGKIYNYVLSDRNHGLVVPNMHWIKVNLAADTILVCLCSSEYNESDYIRDYNEFKKNRN